MSRSTTTVVDVNSPEFVAAVAAAVALAQQGQQSTPAAVVEATTTTPGFAKAGKGLVWFVKTDGSRVKATRKQAAAWDKLRAASQARSASRTPEQRAASAARSSEFLSGAAERKAQREAIKPLNKVLAAANGGTWVAAHEASDAVLAKAADLLKQAGVKKSAIKAALDAAKARRTRKA